ncbi:MAG: hypothetical protein M1829_005528 [Trizodia sp. TS-e1964]|nr:MAG: hypothetical protein M1829_005528 [Trizodia sp. TS-e1964]
MFSSRDFFSNANVNPRPANRARAPRSHRAEPDKRAYNQGPSTANNKVPKAKNPKAKNPKAKKPTATIPKTAINSSSYAWDASSTGGYGSTFQNAPPHIPASSGAYAVSPPTPVYNSSSSDAFVDLSDLGYVRPRDISINPFINSYEDLIKMSAQPMPTSAEESTRIQQNYSAHDAEDDDDMQGLTRSQPQTNKPSLNKKLPILARRIQVSNGASALESLKQYSGDGNSVDEEYELDDQPISSKPSPVVKFSLPPSPSRAPGARSIAGSLEPYSAAEFEEDDYDKEPITTRRRAAPPRAHKRDRSLDSQSESGYSTETIAREVLRLQREKEASAARAPISISSGASGDDMDSEEDIDSVTEEGYMLAQVRELARQNVAHTRTRQGRSRHPWSDAASNLLIDYIQKYGTKWSQIVRAATLNIKGRNKLSDRANGEIVKRGQVAVKDRAINLKFCFLKSNLGEIALPLGFEHVPLRKKMKEELELLGVNFAQVTVQPPGRIFRPARARHTSRRAH